MRKLASAWVSLRDDFFISYRVYIMTGSFHISLFEGTLHVDKIHAWFKIANIMQAHLFQSTGRLISHWNRWSFRVYMIPLQDFVPEWNSCPGTRTGVALLWGDSRRHDILWWYNVNPTQNQKVIPVWDSRQCKFSHVNTPLLYMYLCL